MTCRMDSACGPAGSGRRRQAPEERRAPGRLMGRGMLLLGV